MGLGHGALVASLHTRLTALPHVRLAYLFGSQATHRARPDSDIDVAVLMNEALVADAGGVNRTLRLLAGRLGGGDVPSERLDVVLLNEAPVLLRHRVLRDGALLYARDDVERVRFAVRTMRDYQDFEPCLAFHRGWRITRLKQATTGMIAKSREPAQQTGKADGGRGDILAAARRAGRILEQSRSPR